MGWILDGKPGGYSREADRADRANWVQEQRWAKAFSHPDEKEIRLPIEGIERGRSRAVSFEVALEETRQAILTHRVRMAA